MFQNILLSRISPDPNQPRKAFDEQRIAELADTMGDHGQLSPILVRPHASDYILVHGERRYRAALSLGWETITAEVRELTDAQARRLALIENIQREGLTPLEEARAYQAILDTGLTQAALGKQIGKQQSYIAQKLRLLNMPRPLVELVERRAITENHARQLLKLKGWYHGATEGTPFAPEAPHTFDDLFPLVAEENPTMILNEIRPLDQIMLFRIPESKRDNITAALAACWEIAQTDNSSWIRIATFWGCAAHLRDMSVSELSKRLDTFMGQVYSALYEVKTYKDLPHGSKPLSVEWFHYWIYRADARHAGVSGDNTPRELMLDAYRWMQEAITTEGGHYVPSACQRGGQHYEAYREAVDKGGAR